MKTIIVNCVPFTMYNMISVYDENNHLIHNASTKTVDEIAGVVNSLASMYGDVKEVIMTGGDGSKDYLQKYAAELLTKYNSIKITVL